jgi:hypothetical protein
MIERISPFVITNVPSGRVFMADPEPRSFALDVIEIVSKRAPVDAGVCNASRPKAVAVIMHTQRPRGRTFAFLITAPPKC